MPECGVSSDMQLVFYDTKRMLSLKMCTAIHVVTKPAQILSHFFWNIQSIFLIGPHTPATLGCWPGSSACVDQSERICEEVLSKFKQFFQTKLMLHQVLPTFVAT